MAGPIKYIVIESEFLEKMIVFNETLTHKEMARGRRPISAGFLYMTNKDGKLDPKAYGKSISLRLDSRPEEDTKIARRLFNCEN